MFCSAKLIKPSIVLFVVWTLLTISEICLDLICSWIVFRSCGAGSLPSSVAWANFLTWSVVLNPNESTAYSNTGSVVNTYLPLALSFNELILSVIFESSFLYMKNITNKKLLI